MGAHRLVAVALTRTHTHSFLKSKTRTHKVHVSPLWCCVARNAKECITSSFSVSKYLLMRLKLQQIVRQHPIIILLFVFFSCLCCVRVRQEDEGHELYFFYKIEVDENMKWIFFSFVRSFIRLALE